MKTGTVILTFGNVEIKKNEFYRHKVHIVLKHVDTEKELVSNKTSAGEKNNKSFISYLYNDHKFKSLHIMLPKKSTYVKRYDG